MVVRSLFAYITAHIFYLASVIWYTPSFLTRSTGLATPAIASGFGALAPTLDTIMPVIGAGGFAAVASAIGSVAGSVVVAASFGGD